VLGSLARRDQARIHRRLIEPLLHDGLPFLDDARNTVTMFTARLLAKVGKDLLQPHDLSARLVEVRFERRPKIW